MHHSTPSHKKRPSSRAFCHLVGVLDGHTYEAGALEDRCLRMNAFFENSNQTISNQAKNGSPLSTVLCILCGSKGQLEGTLTDASYLAYSFHHRNICGGFLSTVLEKITKHTAGHSLGS